MKSFSKRVASFTMAAAMVLSLAAVPTTDAEAASYSLTKKTSITSSKTGKYYIKGVSKKQYVKVSVSGAAKSGVTVKTSAGKKLTSSKKLNGTGKTLTLKVTNKGVVGKSYKLTAKVYNSNNKVVKTLTSTTYVKNNNFTLSNSEVSVVEEQTATVTATAKYKYSTGTYTWATADANIATVADGVITGVNAGTTTVTVTRGNFTETVKVTVTEGPVKVTSATAKNAKTIELAGRHLDKLTVKNVAIDGYTVETIKASEDGKTATATLGSALIPNKDEVFKVTIDGTTTDFSVKYSTAAAAVAVQDAMYKVGASDRLTVLINGVATSYDELKANGYKVAFYAFKEDTNGALQSYDALLDATTPGKLAGNASVVAGVYKVKVVLTGTSTLQSDYATITITNEGANELGIVSVKMKQAVSGNFIYDITGDAMALQVGDSVVIDDVIVSTSYGVNKSAISSNVILKSSNTAVATVEKVSGQNAIVAHKSGTASITMTYGKLSKTINLTVKTDGRTFKTVKAPGTKTAVIETSVEGDIFAVDNYDAYMVGQNIYVELPQSNTAVSSNTFTVSGIGTPVTTSGNACVKTGTNGAVKVQYTASSVAGAMATFNIYKGTGTSYEGMLLATFNVTNAARNSSSLKLDVVKDMDFSADTAIDFNPLKGDDKIKIKLFKYYNNVSAGTVSFDDTSVSGNTITYDDSIIKVTSGNTTTTVANNTKLGTATIGVTELVIKPVGKAGSTTIVIKDKTQSVVASIGITVTNTVPGISDVKLAFDSITYDVNSTIDYRNVLSVVPNVENPEVPGVKFTDGKNYTVKLCTTNDTAYKLVSGVWVPNSAVVKGDLYIDTAEGKLIIGRLGYKLTVGNNSYVPVTDSLTISANQATSIIFGICKDDMAVKNVLESSISVNSYK